MIVRLYMYVFHSKRAYCSQTQDSVVGLQSVGRPSVVTPEYGGRGGETYKSCLKHASISLHDLFTCRHSFITGLQSNFALRSNHTEKYNKRLWWSRGSVLAFCTQVRGFKPSRSRGIFQGEKILSTPFFGREVKPFVPCRIFVACKRVRKVYAWKSQLSVEITGHFSPK